jgi:hypothetical protein
MTTPNDPSQQPLTPNGLVEQLFNAAFAQNPREAASQVIDFLASSLFYAVTSAKRDVVVFLTEAIIYVVSASSADEAARKELLKHVGDTIANAPPIQTNKPAAGKP